MNIIDALQDKNLFGSFLGPQQQSWENWKAALRVLYGLRTGRRHRKLIEECTGRPRSSIPRGRGFDEALFLVGRRSGKSRVAALVGAFEALFGGHESRLAKGEEGLVIVTAPTRRQAHIVTHYIEAVFDTPILKQEVVKDRGPAGGPGLVLRNGLAVEVQAGDFRTIRGFTLVAAIVDETAFFGVEEESRIRSDTELIRAIRPGLVTTGGRLISVTSPYAKRGYVYRTHKEHFGNEASPILVWHAPSQRMNPTLPQSVIDRALQEDRAAARSEFLAEFREDIAEFLPRSLVESLVVENRKELVPHVARRYFAFCDLSGGRSDAAALAIAHRDGTKIVLDKVAHYKAPFNPYEIVREMARELKRFNLARLAADNYAAEFVVSAFRGEGVMCVKATKPKSELYLELLPVMCSGQIELLDNEVLIDQLSNLERRTRSGGRDSVDHPPGAHDDLANAVAGVAVGTGSATVAGALGCERAGAMAL